MKEFIRVMQHLIMVLSTLLIANSALANTQFEMCQMGIKSPSSTQKTPIKFVLDKSFRGPVSIYWLDFKGQLKLYKHLNPGQQYGLNTYVGHEWVVIPGNNQQNGCAYYKAGRNNTIHISDHNAPNTDGSYTYSGTWKWSNHAGKKHDKNNYSEITVWANGKVHYCYNDQCFDTLAKDHGSYTSFTGKWGYYEFVHDNQRNVLLGSFWPLLRKGKDFPHATVTMHPGGI